MVSLITFSENLGYFGFVLHEDPWLQDFGRIDWIDIVLIKLNIWYYEAQESLLFYFSKLNIIFYLVSFFPNPQNCFSIFNSYFFIRSILAGTLHCWIWASFEIKILVINEFKSKLNIIIRDSWASLQIIFIPSYIT